MKANISLALNALLIIAVAYLFTQQGGRSAPSVPADAAINGAAAGQIVYLNADTLLSKYEDFREKQQALAARQKEASQRLNQQMQALETEFRQVQAKIQQGLLAPNQIASEEQRLGQKQQELMAEQEQLSSQLGSEQQLLLGAFQEKLMRLMDSLQEARGYDYILQYGQGSGILGAKDNYDITADVLSILNSEGE